MKQTVASIGAILVTAALITALVLGHAAAQQPRVSVNHAASAAVVDSPSASPSPVIGSPSPVAVASTAPNPVAPAPAPPSQPAATVQNPLPSPSPSPVQAQPSPTPSPSPDPSVTPTPVPSPSPTPPPPCSWSIDVSTLTGTNTWSPLGTWTGSSVTSTSPLFVTGVYGWLSYTYTFSASCVGHASLASRYYTDGALIYNDNITSTNPSTRQANTPPSSEVVFVVTVQ